MKLGGLEKLMARLCLKITPSQLNKLLACTVLPAATKDNITSTIKLLKTLRKHSKSVEEFISKVEKCLSSLDDAHDISDLLTRFHKLYPRLNELECEPPHTLTSHKPTEQQSWDFNKVLVEISNQLTSRDLEILVALSPIPESRKESVDSGFKLFEEMKRRGCVSECDTQLLNDLFHVLKLTTPADLLNGYKQMYPDEIAPPLDNYPSFGSGPLNNQSHRIPPSHPTAITPSHSTPLYRSQHTPPHPAHLPPLQQRTPPHQRTPPEHTSSHPPGFSTAHEESTPIKPVSDSRIAPAISSPLAQVPHPPIPNQRMFNVVHSVHGGSLSSLQQSSIHSSSENHRPGNGSFNGDASIYPEPVIEATPSAPPLSDIQPAAKGTLGAEKFVNKELHKPVVAVSSADLNLLHPAHSRPTPLQPMHAPVSVPSDSQPAMPISTEAASTTQSSLASYTPFNSDRFGAPVSVSSKEYGRAVTHKAAEKSAGTRGASQQQRSYIEQNSKTRAKPAEESSSTVPVASVYKAMNGPKHLKSATPVLGHKDVERMEGAEFGSVNNEATPLLQSKTRHANGDTTAASLPGYSGYNSRGFQAAVAVHSGEQLSNGDSDNEDYPSGDYGSAGESSGEDEYLSPAVAEETTPPSLRRKRTREQGPQEELVALRKKPRPSEGVTTRAKSSRVMSGLKWLFGVKQEDKS